MNTGPGTPEAASANASSTAGPSSRTRRILMKRLTCGATSGRWSMSCSAPRPCSAVGAAPPIRISGDCASWAFFSAVMVLVMPGPAVTAATPGRPESRALASAAKTAVASSRTSTIRMPRALAAVRIGEMWPPHSVKMQRTPCACSEAATRSPPCGLGGMRSWSCQSPAVAVQAQSTLPCAAYHPSTRGATEASMRARLIFIVGVRQPFSIAQGSRATTIMRSCA